MSPICYHAVHGFSSFATVPLEDERNSDFPNVFFHFLFSFLLVFNLRMCSWLTLSIFSKTIYNSSIYAMSLLSPRFIIPVAIKTTIKFEPKAHNP